MTQGSSNRLSHRAVVGRRAPRRCAGGSPRSAADPPRDAQRARLGTEGRRWGAPACVAMSAGPCRPATKTSSLALASDTTRGASSAPAPRPRSLARNSGRCLWALNATFFLPPAPEESRGPPRGPRKGRAPLAPFSLARHCRGGGGGGGARKSARTCWHGVEHLREGRGVSDQYGVRDAAYPISTG
jgi:hypothetical protein